jgi:hypothetical protein
MADLLFTVVGEGSRDAALVPIIEWLLADLLPGMGVEGFCANDGDLPSARDLPGRIVDGLKAQPRHVLFVHRDADSAGRQARIMEIERALTAARDRLSIAIPVVPVVPARMVETWLLTDRAAIRRAAGNPNGRMTLPLPRPRELERMADPKGLLNALVLAATGLSAHRQQRFVVNTVAVAQATVSFDPLRQLSAFQALEADVERVIREQGWPGTLPDQP